MNEQSMTLVTAEIQKNDSGDYEETFNMRLNNKDCPYSSAIYIPRKKVLCVLDRDKKLTIVPSGPDKGKQVEIFNEHYIITHNEIVNFVNRWADNANEFDFLRYMKENNN